MKRLSWLVVIVSGLAIQGCASSDGDGPSINPPNSSGESVATDVVGSEVVGTDALQDGAGGGSDGTAIVNDGVNDGSMPEVDNESPEVDNESQTSGG